MTKRTGRYGEFPPGATRQGQPTPAEQHPQHAATRIDRVHPLATEAEGPISRLTNPMETLRPENAAIVFGSAAPVAALVPQPKETTAMAPVAPPPEIGLTQHVLPGPDFDPRLSLLIDPDSEASAAFRVLRHHLLEVGRPQCVIISSPLPKEGKTTTAVNLALALAECGRAKVLLAEAHVARPQLADIFEMSPPWCFVEQLVAHRHQPMMPWSVVELPKQWLHVAAINPRIEKTQLLDGPAFAIAMERLRLAGYDHIIVDAPPILGSADVNLMADAADAVVLTVRGKTSNSRDLRKAIDQIGANKVAGTVLLER
ncbi:MAG: CpsD/CapB family tyrosine-protein kinase [Kofleriaceae bacterium]